MTRGKLISEDLRWAIVRSCQFLHIDFVSMCTNVSKRQILRILAQYKRTGTVLEEDRPKKTGRKQQLTADELAVSVPSLFF